MSAFNSFGSAISKKYPSCFSPRNSDHSTMVDLEPGRCRRTDGRKWRCSKSVVPNQKYCERHVHRGRRGSRKPVEPTESVSGPDDQTSLDNKMPLISMVISKADDGAPVVAKHRDNKNHDVLLADACNLGKEVNKNANIDNATTSLCVDSMNNGVSNEVNYSEGKESSFDYANYKISGRKQTVAKNNYPGFISARFGLSLKSDLHCDAGNADLGLGSKNEAESELKRCRRTDGKKWQCRRDAVPRQNHCEAHMRRGAKRVVLNPDSGDSIQATSALRAPVSGKISLDGGINLNIMPASPLRSSGNTSTSSTSDATTVTDENISLCLNQSLHNC